jgi:hypothetical protein
MLQCVPVHDLCAAEEDLKLNRWVPFHQRAAHDNAHEAAPQRLEALVDALVEKKVGVEVDKFLKR